MQQAVLSNAIKMPFVGLGVFQMGNDQEVYTAVRSALDLGYRHIDTAMIYENEAALGRAIKDSQIAREDIFLTTKLWPTDIRTKRIEQAFELSLAKLQTEYIDLYLIHWPVKEQYVSAWQSMEQIYQSGRAKAIGVSNYQRHHLEDLLADCSLPPMVNQFEIHPYLTQADLVSYCQSKNIQPQAYSPLCAQKNDLLEQPILLELAKKYAKSSAQIVLRWNIERGIVVLPKSASAIRQAENLAIFDFSLSADEVDKINALNSDTRIRVDPDAYQF